jgi:repressor LexA
MSERPTKKQRELLSFIDGFIKGYGYGPSYREIMRALEYKSVSTVATHVDGLIQRGWLIKKDNSARSLVVLDPEATASRAIMHVDTERDIRRKIEELKADHDKNSDAIQTLTRTLEILGFTEVEETHLA